MRHLKICLFILGLFYSSEIYAQCKGTLIFSDEFNGTTLDATKWNYELGNGCPSLCGWGNSEQEYYTNSTNNVSVSGGYLSLTAMYQNNYAGSGTNFTSGKINTKGKFDHTYGRYEARIKLSAGTGVWPAFWMLPTSNVYGSWPASGEIDIMENNGVEPNKMNSTLHYGTTSNHQYDSDAWNLPNSQSLMADFHIFAVEWTATNMKFYCDGALIKTETKSPNTLNPASPGNPWPWDQNYYIILNLALGGGYTGYPSEAAILASGGFPKSMLVDYVRVYDLGSATSEIAFSPSSAVSLSLPGKIEAENYDDGCSGSAYLDTDIGNNGNVYRFDNVDIEYTGDVGGGYHVGWGAATEYLKYTVNVASTGTYNFTFRGAGNIGYTSTFRMEVDGTDVTGTLNFPDTGSWGTWADIVKNNVTLTAGAHVIRFYYITGGFSLNYINVVSASLPVTLADWSAQREENQIELEWSTYKEENNDKFILERSGDGVSFETIYVTNGHGTTTLQHSYSFADQSPLPGKNYYRLKQVDLDGQETICGNSLLVLMNGIATWEVYPVPVNDELQLSGVLYSDTKVDVIIYDARGIVIAERSGISLNEGIQYVSFNSSNWSEGVYTVNIIDHTAGTVVKKRLVKA